MQFQFWSFSSNILHLTGKLYFDRPPKSLCVINNKKEYQGKEYHALLSQFDKLMGKSTTFDEVTQTTATLNCIVNHLGNH